MAERRRVVVTGAGLLTPLGDSPAAVHAALLAGRSARRPVELFPTTGLGCREAGEILPFEPRTYLGERNLRPLDRTARLLTAAAQLALAASGWDAPALAREEVGLVAGTTFGSVRTIAEFDRRSRRIGPAHASPFEFANSVINAAAGQTAIWHGLRGVNSTIAAGEASALVALAQAAEMVRAGRSAALLAGGAEELCFESFFGHCRAGRLCGSRPGAASEVPVPFDARRNGFSLSEGAGLLMLEDAESATARGGRVRAELLGWGTAFALADEHGSADAATATLAAAVARAVRLALADAAAAPEEIGCVSAAANGSPLADRAEAHGIAAALGAAVPVAAIKAMLGEGMGASGAWQAIDLLETMAGGELPGIAGLEQPEPGLPLGGLAAASRYLPDAARRRVLATALGTDGHCAALVLGAPR